MERSARSILFLDTICNLVTLKCFWTAYEGLMQLWEISGLLDVLLASIYKFCV